MLGPQGIERVGSHAQVHPRKGQGGSAGHLDGRDEEGGQRSLRIFVETCGVKDGKAVAKLVKDREELLAFFDFPAEHWKHTRTANPIKSVFTAVRNSTRKTKYCLSQKN